MLQMVEPNDSAFSKETGVAAVKMTKAGVGVGLRHTPCIVRHAGTRQRNGCFQESRL